MGAQEPTGLLCLLLHVSHLPEEKFKEQSVLRPYA